MDTPSQPRQPAAFAGFACARHPGAPVVDACERCGSFTCRACISSRAGRALCVSCVARWAPEPLRAPWRAWVLTAAGAVGLVCSPLAPAVLLLAWWELRRMRREGAAAGHLLWARRALVLGAVGAVLLAVEVGRAVLVSAG